MRPILRTASALYSQRFTTFRPRRNSVQNDGGVFYETAAAFYARFGFEPTAAPDKAADARRALSRRDIGN